MSRNEKYNVLNEKNTLDEINVRLETMEEKINILEDRAIKTTKLRHWKENISENEHQ